MLIADTHVHVYPAYQMARALARAYANLQDSGHRPATFHAGLFLTERPDCHFFADLLSGHHIPDGFRVEKTGEPEALQLFHTETNLRLFIFAGQQVVTSEGIEILALTTTAAIPPGKSAGDTLALIRDAGGLPVLSWAPGKWLFKRGRAIRQLIESHRSGALLLGDISMRARGQPEPSLIRRGRQLGLPVIAGTDPLPFPGDESIMGTYGIGSPAFDPEHPVSSARNLLINGNFILCGRRNKPVAAASRWLKNRIAQRS